MRSRKHVIWILIVALIAVLACAFGLPGKDRPKSFRPPLHAPAFDATKPHNHVPPKGLIIYSQSEPHKADETELFSIYGRNLPGDSKPVQLAGAKENGLMKFADIREMKLSPDGSRLMFQGLALPPCGYIWLDNDTYLSGCNIYVIDIASRKIRALSEDGDGYFDVGWSSDGKWICAYTRYGGSMPEDPTCDSGLCAFSTSGSGAFNPVRYTNNGWIIESAVTSGPAGRVMFSRSVNHVGGRPDPNLYSVPCKGGAVETVIRGEGHRLNYSFSPDGRHMSYVQCSVRHDPNGGYFDNQDGVFYVANADGSFPVAMAKQIGQREASYELRPGQWSPDSTRFAFAEMCAAYPSSFGELRHAYISSILLRARTGSLTGRWR